MLSNPTLVYINWSAYDELSDNVPLTEELALKQLDELIRLRRLGLKFDYYIMDCFWYDPEAGYRSFRKRDWPDGPDRWLNRCKEHGIKPGLWVASNNQCRFNIPEKWRDSTQANAGGDWQAQCCFYGGFLADFVATLDYWYGRGIRAYKFDFAQFGAAPRHLADVMLPAEIRQANITAFSAAMKSFRRTHPDCLFLAYNGFEEVSSQGNTSQLPRKVIDTRWLDMFDAIYCGDPRPADVPAMNFWRAKDVYSDHMVDVYHYSGIPLSRIDSSAFMIGNTGTCYYRKTAAWQGMLLLTFARGGWANTIYGNLELLDSAKAEWFHKAQQLFLPLQSSARFEIFGGVPGRAQPYGYAAFRESDGLLTVVNPAQQIAKMELPIPLPTFARILFHDAGFAPTFSKNILTLGPEQMALIGIGSYASEENDLGAQQDVIIPRSIRPIPAEFVAAGDKSIITTFSAPTSGHVRIIIQQTEPGKSLARRTTGGAPPEGESLGKLLRLTAAQADRSVAVRIAYDKPIWSGLSWAVGEIDAAALDPQQPLTVTFTTKEPKAVALAGAAYHVEY
jgi:hypothetical protein